jgi:hypothetical protein
MGSSQFPKFKKWIKDGILADFSKAWGEWLSCFSLPHTEWIHFTILTLMRKHETFTFSHRIQKEHQAFRLRDDVTSVPTRLWTILNCVENPRFLTHIWDSGEHHSFLTLFVIRLRSICSQNCWDVQQSSRVIHWESFLSNAKIVENECQPLIRTQREFLSPELQQDHKPDSRQRNVLDLRGEWWQLRFRDCRGSIKTFRSMAWCLARRHSSFLNLIFPENSLFPFYIDLFCGFLKTHIVYQRINEPTRASRRREWR